MTHPTDFNDAAALLGLDAVREQVDAAIHPPGAQPADERPEPPEVDEPAAPTAWPDPILPGTRPTPDIPASLLPGWVGDMAAAIAASTQTPPAMAVMVSLSVLATTLQRRFEVAPFGDQYTEPLALWTLTALPSGSRKTSVITALAAPLLYWEKLQRDRSRSLIAKANSAREVAKKRMDRLMQAAGKAEQDAERESIRAEIQREEEAMPDEVRAPRLFTGDCTAERLQNMLVEHGERMAVLSDEGGIFLVMAGAYSGDVASLDVFLQGHAGTALRVDRAGRSAHVDRPALSFGLALQPGILVDAAGSKRFRDSGLLARFLFALPASNVGQRDVRARRPIPEHIANTYERRVLDLLEGLPDPKPGKPRVLGFTDAARELWLDLAEMIERDLGAGGRLEAIADWASKFPGAVARIAALMELAESGLETEEVHEDTMRRAIELGELLLVHAQAVFGLIGADSVDSDARAVLDWARAHDLAEFTQRECQRAMNGRFSNLERLKKAMDRLQAHDVVRSHMRSNKGTHASRSYQVNPKALSWKS